MAYLVTGVDLVEALEAEGFPLPKDCREARLVMAPDSAYVIQYDVFVTDENLAKLGRALVRVSEARQR